MFVSCNASVLAHGVHLTLKSLKIIATMKKVTEKMSLLYSFRVVDWLDYNHHWPLLTTLPSLPPWSEIHRDGAKVKIASHIIFYWNWNCNSLSKFFICIRWHKNLAKISVIVHFRTNNIAKFYLKKYEK